jgi:hypothetical protein
MLLALLSWPPGADAANLPTECRLPPVTSAGDQYCERLPGPNGAGKETAVTAPVRRLEDTLSSALVQRLERAGELGRMLLALPAPPHRAARPPSVAGEPSGALAPAAPPPGRPLDVAGETRQNVAWSGAFRWAMLFTTLGLFAAAWLSAKRSY